MVKTQDLLRSIFGAKELPGLCSHLFLATPPPRYTSLIIIPGSFGPKPCAPQVDPFSFGYPFWAGSDGGLQEGRYLSLSLARIGKSFAYRNSHNKFETVRTRPSRPKESTGRGSHS